MSVTALHNTYMQHNPPHNRKVKRWIPPNATACLRVYRSNITRKTCVCCALYVAKKVRNVTEMPKVQKNGKNFSNVKYCAIGIASARCKTILQAISNIHVSQSVSHRLHPAPAATVHYNNHPHRHPSQTHSTTYCHYEEETDTHDTEYTSSSSSNNSRPHNNR